MLSSLSQNKLQLCSGMSELVLDSRPPFRLSNHKLSEVSVFSNSRYPMSDGPILALKPRPLKESKLYY
jgi:hypothetical protein